MVDTLDHLPRLPLSLYYRHIEPPGFIKLTEQDKLGIYHALRLHDRVYRIDLMFPPSILQKVFELLGGHFPIMEHLFLMFSTSSNNNLPLTLPKAFLGPNLRRLSLPRISPPRRLRLLTSTVSLVALELSNIETSSYFRPRLLATRLRSLPQLEELSIGFSIPIPRPSSERELLGEQGAPVTLPSLKILKFRGVGAYLESLVAQIRTPLLERLNITLFNQIAFALPHLSYMINITDVFKLPSAEVGFYRNEVCISTFHSLARIPFSLHVRCKPLDWQIDCAAQICHALIPTLSDVQELSLYNKGIPTELGNDAIDGAMWHDLLRTFIGVEQLRIYRGLTGEVSRALQVDGVGTNPSFLPNLQSICAKDYLFTSFINTRKAVGRPVQFQNVYAG